MDDKTIWLRLIFYSIFLSQIISKENLALNTFVVEDRQIEYLLKYFILFLAFFVAIR